MCVCLVCGCVFCVSLKHVLSCVCRCLCLLHRGACCVFRVLFLIVLPERMFGVSIACRPLNTCCAFHLGRFVCVCMSTCVHLSVYSLCCVLEDGSVVDMFCVCVFIHVAF